MKVDLDTRGPSNLDAEKILNKIDIEIWAISVLIKNQGYSFF
jgi:hypothetical protein